MVGTVNVEKSNLFKTVFPKGDALGNFEEAGETTRSMKADLQVEVSIHYSDLMIFEQAFLTR